MIQSKRMSSPSSASRAVSLPLVGASDNLAGSGAGTNFFCWIPLELKSRIVSFLSSTDAVLFSEQFPEHGVTVSRLHPDSLLLAHMVWSGYRLTGDQPVRCNVRVPVNRCGGATHSVTLKFRWRDQGWGLRKGQLYIVASDSLNKTIVSPNLNATESKPTAATTTTNATTTDATATASTEELPFDGGRVVCMTTEFAPRAFEEHELSFSPREGEIYNMWYKAGGGGGHTLVVEDCKLSSFIFDDAEHNRTHNYQRLHELGVVGVDQQAASVSVHRFHIDLIGGGMEVHPEQDPTTPDTSQRTFYPKMLLRVCKSLRRQLAAAQSNNSSDCTENSKKRSNGSSNSGSIDPDLVEFMSEYEIPITEASLRIVQEIVQADMEERNRALEESQQRQRDATTRSTFNANPGGAERRPDMPPMPQFVHAMFAGHGGPGGGAGMFVAGGDVAAMFDGALPADNFGGMMQRLQRQINGAVVAAADVAAHVLQPGGAQQPDNNRAAQPENLRAPPQVRGMPFHAMMMPEMQMPNFGVAAAGVDIDAAFERINRRLNRNDEEDDDEERVAVD